MKSSTARQLQYKRKRWALREELKKQLGNVCAHLGMGECAGGLEFDHINGRDYELRKLGRDTRVKRLIQEIARGEIQLLCRRHNARKG